MVAPNGDVEWVITNNFAFALTQQLVETTTRTRWQVEEFHRSFKQFTGTGRCQCRRAQAQRNHLACCYLAWGCCANLLVKRPGPSTRLNSSGPRICVNSCKLPLCLRSCPQVRKS